MKLLVQTKGNYALHDLIGRQTVQAYRPCVVTKTAFIEANRAGKLEILEELGPEADDLTLAAATTAEELKAAIQALPRAGGSAPKSKRPTANKA